MSDTAIFAFFFCFGLYCAGAVIYAIELNVGNGESNVVHLFLRSAIWPVALAMRVWRDSETFTRRVPRSHKEPKQLRSPRELGLYDK